MKRSIFLAIVLAMILALLPSAALASPNEGGCAYVHVVRYGETLSGIASRYGVSMWSIMQANNIANANRIYAGTRLCIPGYYPQPKPTPKPTPKPVPCPPHQLPPGHPPVPCPMPPPPPPPACSVLPVLGFGQIWYSNTQVRNALGCALAPEYGLSAYEQYFKGGYAVGDMNTKMVYAMYDNRTWSTFPTNFDPAAPSPYLVPPLGGQYLPRPVAASMQQFQGGLMLWTASKGFYVLYNNGAWQFLN